MITLQSNTNVLTRACKMLKLTTTTNVFNYSAVEKLHVIVTQSKKSICSQCRLHVHNVKPKETDKCYEIQSSLSLLHLAVTSITPRFASPGLFRLAEAMYPARVKIGGGGLWGLDPHWKTDNPHCKRQGKS